MNSRLMAIIIFASIVAFAFFATMWISARTAGAHEMPKAPMMNWRLNVATFEGQLYRVFGTGRSSEGHILALICTTCPTPSGYAQEMLLVTEDIGKTPWAWLLRYVTGGGDDEIYAPKNYDLVDTNCDGVYDLHRHGEDMMELRVPLCTLKQGK